MVLGKRTFPLVSIVIPTHNSESTIKECLESVMRLDYPREKFEVIIVDDSEDDTKQVAMDYDVTILCLKAPPGAKRNFGVKKARGDIVAFTDSDCIVREDWLKNLTKYFTFNVGGVGGPNLTPENDPYTAKCIGLALSSWFGSGGIRYARTYKYVRTIDHNPTCNSAFWKSVYEEVGGFNENSWPTEDVELDYRVRKGGYELIYAPDVVVWHRRRSSLKLLFHQIYGYGFNRLLFARKYPALLKPIHFVPALALLIVTFLAFHSLFSVASRWLLASCIIGYIITGVASAMQASKFTLKCVPRILLLSVIIHVSWAFGFLWALVKRTH